MAMIMTQAGEQVGWGDLVALDVLLHPDAIGCIVGGDESGDIQCVLVRCGHCKPGRVVTVAKDQILLRVRSNKCGNESEAAVRAHVQISR